MTSSSQAHHADDHGDPPDHGAGPDKPGKPDKIEIVVITTADDLDREFDRHLPLCAVFERALGLVGGHGQADQFALEYHDQPLTDLDRALGDLAQELGWGDRVELELVPKPVVV